MADDVHGREHLVRRQQAVTAVFKRFATFWPRAFAPSTWASSLEPWLDALEWVSTDVIEQAARELLRTAPKYPPKPWELAEIARTLDGRHAGMVQGPGTAQRVEVWEWFDREGGRLSRAERRADGTWIWHAVEPSLWFYDADDDARRAHCERMVLRYPMPMLTTGAA